MRVSRVLVVVALMATVTAGAVAVASASGPAHKAMSGVSAARHPALQASLRQELRQWLAAQPLLAAPRLGVTPSIAPPSTGGQTCFVGPGSCSETPCRVFVHSQASAAVTAVPRSPVAFETTAALAPAIRPAQPLASACPSGNAPPRSLRVASRITGVSNR